MFIAIRKESNDSLYMDKNIYSRMETVKFTIEQFEDFKLQNPNLEYTFENIQETIEMGEICFNEETQKREVTITNELVDYVLVTKRVFTDEELSEPPYNYTKIKIDDKYSDCQSSDFNDDLTFNLDKYNARKQIIANEDYENKIVALIRKKYNVNQELAILRQRDTKPEEFAEYNEYVEQCKEQVKNGI